MRNLEFRIFLSGGHVGLARDLRGRSNQRSAALEAGKSVGAAVFSRGCWVCVCVSLPAYLYASCFPTDKQKVSRGLAPTGATLFEFWGISKRCDATVGKTCDGHRERWGFSGFFGFFAKAIVWFVRLRWNAEERSPLAWTYVGETRSVEQLDDQG